MARGPAATQEEIKKAHELFEQGKKPEEIARLMKRAALTIYKMLVAAKPQ